MICDPDDRIIDVFWNQGGEFSISERSMEKLREMHPDCGGVGIVSIPIEDVDRLCATLQQLKESVQGHE